VRVLVLTANTLPPTRVFSAGYHIGEFDDSGRAPMAFEQVPDALARVRALTVCALSGSVYGGATDLALACDFRIGIEGMELRMPAAALGLHYYPSGLRRYVARLGLGATRKLFLLAQPATGPELLAMGYLDRLVPSGEWGATLNALVQDVLALAPLAVQETKRSLNEIASGHYNEQRLREREHETCASADFAEGRAAFAERRKPVFRGR